MVDSVMARQLPDLFAVKLAMALVHRKNVVAIPGALNLFELSTHQVRGIGNRGPADHWGIQLSISP